MIVIDGHNLIPKIEGMSLGDIDDEMTLIQLLQHYLRKRRGPIEVFFDGAPPGQAGKRSFGAGLNAHFVAAGQTADNAIRRYLDLQGKNVRSVTVVSSDRTVLANARELHASVMLSEEFAAQLEEIRPQVQGPKKTSKAPTTVNQPNGVTDWLELFGIDPKDADKPIEMGKKGKKPKNNPR